MKGTTTRFDRIDDMARTKTAFGTSYRMSGKTIKFDHTNSLISTNTNISNGYVQLDDRYNQLVMQIKTVSSTLNYSSAKTTLYYINNAGAVASHDYGDLDLSSQQNFNLVFDLSPNTLKDGCRGLVSMSNNNWSSTLTITFGDVYLSNGRQFAASVSGDFVADDSNILDYTSDEACTSLDMTEVNDLVGTEMPHMANGNAVVYMPDGYDSNLRNAIVEDICPTLSLDEQAGTFRPIRPFTAQQASCSCLIEGMRMLMLPFKAAIPQDVKAYRLTEDLGAAEPCFRLSLLEDTIPACTPVLVEGNGVVSFLGDGEVAAYTSPINAVLRGTFSAVPLYKGDYVLTQEDGKWGFARLSGDGILRPFGVYANVSSKLAFIPVIDDAAGIRAYSAESTLHEAYYDLQGRRLQTKPVQPGVYIYRNAHGKTQKIRIER